MALASDGKMWCHNFTVTLDQLPDIKTQFTDLLKDSGFGVLNFIEEHFEPHGYSAMWLLSESHLAVHTFPETGEAIFQLASCNLEKYMNFIQELSKRFK